jgi:hypothetical protein
VSQGLKHGQAFEQAFGADGFAEFEAAWKKYVLALKPDPVSTAADRLEFLAVGLVRLREQDEHPGSINELRRLLRERRFRMSTTSHGVVRKTSAEDARNFEAPPSGDRKKPAKLVMTPSRDPKFPPALSVEGLKVRVRLVWDADGDGNPRHDVVFE